MTGDSPAHDATDAVLSDGPWVGKQVRIAAGAVSIAFRGNDYQFDRLTDDGRTAVFRLVPWAPTSTSEF
jgi:hypothetical protein